jgi:hypothetical protein
VSPPPRTPTAPRTAPPRTAPDAPAVDLDAPRPNPGETVTLTALIGTTHIDLYSSKAGHRIQVTKDGTERQIIEYPADSWASAARYVVGAAERAFQAAGSATRGAAFCGDCSSPVHRGACPAHGEIG